NVSNHQAKSFLAEVQKVVVIPANRSRLDAHAGILKRAKRWLGLWKQASLYVLRNLHLLSDSAFEFKLFRDRTTSGFHLARHLVKTHQRERVVIDILKAGEHTAPNRCTRGVGIEM